MRFFQLLLNYEEGTYDLALIPEIPHENEIHMGIMEADREKVTFKPAPGLKMTREMRDAFNVMATNIVRRKEEENKRLRSLK